MIHMTCDNDVDMKRSFMTTSIPYIKKLSTVGCFLFKSDTRNLDKGMIVGAIFVDFKKALDSISHNILSSKLQAIGLSENLHGWLMDYL